MLNTRLNGGGVRPLLYNVVDVFQESAIGWQPLQRISCILVTCCTQSINVCKRQKERKKENRERKTIMMLPPMCITVLLHYEVGISISVISKWASQDLESPNNYWFDVDTLNGRGEAGQHPSPPSASLGWLKLFGSPNYPNYDWVDHRW